MPTLRGLDQPFRDTTLVQTGDDGGDGWAYRGVRTDRYLYGVNGADAFLYDDDLDPDQLVNRIDDPAYAAVRAALEERRSRLITLRRAGSATRRSAPCPSPARRRPVRISSPFGPSRTKGSLPW